MKRFTALLLSSLLLVTTAFANPIDPKKASEIATAYWGKTVKSNSKTVLTPISRNEMSKAGSRFATPKANPGFYIFTPENGTGFVIISGDDALTPVIGYSTTATTGEMPPALCELLSVYDMYVNDVRNGIAKPVLPVTTLSGSNIEPMLTTTWNQSTPYNNMCPQVNGSYTPTGCTATAVAQIMKFHDWPDKPSKSFTWYNNVTGENETVNTSSHKYDWENMLDSYRGEYTTTEADAVALLMSDVGKAMNSNYALGGTGSTPQYASQALVNFFKYSPDIIVAKREEYTNEEYMELIRSNLEARQPLMYAGHGQDYASGHAFVCDGINENNLLHINWGWGGSYDGYFDITSMAPGGAGIGGGEDRYNVGQAIIANIRPRVTGEANVNGQPTIYALRILDPDADNKTVDESVKTFVNNEAKQGILFGLLNWSHSTAKMQIAIHFEKEGELYKKLLLNDSNELIELKMNENSGYSVNFAVNNTPDGDLYLEKGIYNARFYYSDGGENSDFELIRGSENNIVIEVSESGTRTYILQPKIKVTELTFRRTPSQKGDPLSFDAKFENTNKRNSLVIIAPVVNRKLADNTYKSDTLTKATAMIDVYDDQEITASFENAGTFPQDGTYHISFVCNVLNSYTERATELDRKSAISIIGKSQDITISPLPDGLVLSITALSATDITYGEKAEISGTVKNISTSDNKFTGALGLFAKDNTTGKEYLLATTYVENLDKGAATDISYKTPDYLPVMQPGSYTIIVKQADNGRWKEIRQSAATCIQNIASTTAAIPYVKKVMDINNGNDVIVKGESFEVDATLGCLNTDFDGYVRVNIPYGLGYHVRSEYVAVSIKKGETADVTFQCESKTSTPLNKYRLNIIYYDSSKKKLGDMSNNTLSYSGNGYFWIGDGTDIEETKSVGNATVTVCGNTITVDNAEDASVTVYSTDGRKVYHGTDNTIAVAKGMYIVTVQHAGTTTTSKIFIK